MSRNPYLAASRPSSSYTRPSRSTIGRSGYGATGSSAISVGLLLGRSRSSAALSSQLSSATGCGSSYIPTYVPSTPTWQRSSSSTRDASSSNNNNNNKFSNSNLTENRTDGAKSGSSPCFNNSSASTDLDESDHLKNYQQSKLQQPTPTFAPRISTNRPNVQSLDPEQQKNSIRQDSSSEEANDKTPARRPLGSLEDNLEENNNQPKVIGDSIPSLSARNLTKSPKGQMPKSKSVDLASEQQKQDNQPSLLSGTMSVDRLISRAESMGERDLREYFKELVMENDRLKQQIKGFDDIDKLKQQEWIRKERQLQRKISELEEENKLIEQWKQEIQRLKDENNSLIRVVSKLTKQ